MTYVPTKSQRTQMRRLMETDAHLVNEKAALRVALLVDEPNAYFSARGTVKGFGQITRQFWRSPVIWNGGAGPVDR